MNIALVAATAIALEVKMTDFNELSRLIYEQNKAVGWWDEPRSVKHTLMLVVSEIAEATEAERKDLMDDKLPHRKGGEVELADALIRTLDLAGHLSVEIGQVKTRPLEFDTPLELHFYATRLAVYCNEDRASYLPRLVSLLLSIGEALDYDIMAAMYEKLEYNKTRADHTREARAAENGKKY